MHIVNVNIVHRTMKTSRCTLHDVYGMEYNGDVLTPDTVYFTGTLYLLH